MPKSKKKSESSDSDSGPDDKNKKEPPPKKAKKPDPPKGSDEPQTWILEKYRMVRISEFRGRKSVDIREHYEKDGNILPGKKGIALTAFQWKMLLDHADEITKAIENQ